MKGSANAAWITEKQVFSGPMKEDTVTVPKIAAVERRKARPPVTRRAGAFVEVPKR